MRPGESREYKGSQFRRMFPAPTRLFWAPKAAGPISQFLSLCMSSAWGTVRCVHDEARDVYIVSRHEQDIRPDGKRYHVAFEQERYYRRGDDGLWEPLEP